MIGKVCIATLPSFEAVQRQEATRHAAYSYGVATSLHLLLSGDLHAVRALLSAAVTSNTLTVITALIAIYHKTLQDSVSDGMLPLLCNSDCSALHAESDIDLPSSTSGAARVTDSGIFHTLVAACHSACQQPLGLH